MLVICSYLYIYIEKVFFFLLNIYYIEDFDINKMFYFKNFIVVKVD